MGIKSFETLAEADPRRIELVTGRKFPFGNHIKESLTSLPPKVDIKIEVSECLRQGKSKLAVTLTRLSSQGVQSTKRHYADMIVASEEENLILFHEKISRVDEFLSFIHAVGVDLHEKLLLVKESNSNANLKRARKPTQFFAPEEVYVIEDDKAATHKSFAQRPPDLIESKRESSSVPSFNLLDEELEEFAAGIENDDCKIITEQSIFDHIQEKAKNFPLLTPNNAYSPSSDQEKSKIRQHILLGPLPESKGLEQIADDHNNYLTGKHHITAGSSVTINLTDESGYLPSEPEAFSFKSLTEEAIFDHIRKKSKHFPVINMPKPIDTDCCICTEEHNSVNQPGSGNATLGTSKDAMVISEPEPGEVNRDACGTKAGTKTKNNVLQGSSSGANGESAVSPKVSSTKTATLSVQMLSFDISMAKNSKHLADLGSSIQDGWKDKPSPSDSKRQSRSLASTDQAREVGSFLGFQSVFSFL
ncbi:putative ATP-dependent DNA helicase HFM1 [Gossypium arboreum]|uniref:Putative ATP-dependent DNA helicase HFM1 n=1 Tax=Gossypium arboreum TaxID=29729 RepID=A0A0B0PJ59_GOSAR|nr:putative ATP-dependent DNA helicase HFM1 [Gossypium arboreum]